MAKSGLELDKLQPILTSHVARNGWSLCVGAGISLPLFPDWGALVCSLYEHVQPGSAPVARKMLTQYSPDALIESVKNRSALSDDAFTQLLSDKLYALLKEKMSPSDYNAFCQVLAEPRWSDISKFRWREFLRIFDLHFRDTTALALAEVICSAVQSSNGPRAILSFNAEPTFLLALHAKLIQRHSDLSIPTPSEGELRQHFAKITHSISPRMANRTPFFFCHGLLPVPDVGTKTTQRSSIDKLVSSEGSYLSLANSTFSWQSSVFLDACVGTCIVFVGVSLSDSNMRRWLAWVHSNKLAELRERGESPLNSTSHLWIRTAPTDPAERGWIESSVAHLGVRIVWIPGWKAVGECVGRLLAVV